MQANVLRFAKKPAPTRGSVMLPGWGLVLFLQNNADFTGERAIRCVEGECVSAKTSILNEISNACFGRDFKHIRISEFRIRECDSSRKLICIVQ